jgi:hypothetical protein
MTPNHYTYTIFDSDPAVGGPCAWPSHDGVDIEADSDSEALDDVRDALEIEACGLSAPDYDVGDRLYATVWGDDGVTVGTITHRLTAEDLN